VTSTISVEEQTHVLPPKEHPKPAKDPKRREAGRKGAEARKRKSDTLLAELAAARRRCSMLMTQMSWFQRNWDGCSMHIT